LQPCGIEGLACWTGGFVPNFGRFAAPSCPKEAVEANSAAAIARYFMLLIRVRLAMSREVKPSNQNARFDAPAGPWIGGGV
jgi:hypothetical protein